MRERYSYLLDGIIYNKKKKIKLNQLSGELKELELTLEPLIHRPTILVQLFKLKISIEKKKEKIKLAQWRA
jgi:hypothetical protein